MNKPDWGGPSAPAPYGDTPPPAEVALLQRRLELQRLLGEISSHFINLPTEQIDGNINLALERVGSFLGFNLVAISKFSGQGSAGEVTHIWTAQGLPPTPPGFTELDFPWLAERLTQGHPVHLTGLQDLPAEGQRDRQTYERLGIRSVYNWPLRVGGATVGCLGLASVGHDRPFPADFEKDLKLLAQVMASTLARARADLALRQSETRLNLAAEAAAAGLWSLNLATGCFWPTKKTRELFDIADDEVLTLERFLSLVNPDDQDRIRQTVQAAVQSQNEVQVEYRIARPGRVHWMLSRGRVQRSLSGKPNSLMGVSVDITPLKQAEQALHEAQATLNAIIDSTSDMIWSVDPDLFGLLTFNQGLSEYFFQQRGIRIKPGMRPEDLFPAGEYVQRWRGFYQKALQEGPFTREYLVYAQCNTLHLSFNPLKPNAMVKSSGCRFLGRISPRAKQRKERRMNYAAIWRTPAG